MGYSARYHAFSIIAIFVALAIGIVIGAGFGQDLVSSASEDLEQSLSSDLEEANQREEELAADLERERAFGLRVYPSLVDGRLQGRSIGVIALGDLPESLTRAIEATVEPTGGELTRVAVVREPPDLAALSERLGPAYQDLADDESQLERLGRRLGAQLVDGGRLVDRTREQLLARFSGARGGVDDVFLVARPSEEPSEEPLSEEELASLETFQDALLDGIDRAGQPAVAVELSSTSPSTVPLFDAHDISTVDSLDLTSGKLSAIFALLGSEGNFGVKETADQEIPDLVLPAPGTGQAAGAAAQQGR